MDPVFASLIYLTNTNPIKYRWGEVAVSPEIGGIPVVILE